MNNDNSSTVSNQQREVFVLCQERVVSSARFRVLNVSHRTSVTFECINWERATAMKKILCVLACSLAWIAPAYGQVCAGGASFAQQPYQVNASLLTNDGGKVFTLGAGLGKDVWWGQGGLSFTSFDGVDGTANGFFITGGGEYAVDSDKKISACPIVSVDHSGGVNDFDGSSNLISFGGSVGYTANKTDSLTVIPTGGLFLHHQSFNSPISNAFDASDNFASLQIAVGLLFSEERFALIPGVVLPIGEEGGKNSFQIKFAYYFGK